MLSMFAPAASRARFTNSSMVSVGIIASSQAVNRSYQLPLAPPPPELPPPKPPKPPPPPNPPPPPPKPPPPPPRQSRRNRLRHRIHRPHPQSFRLRPAHRICSKKGSRTRCYAEAWRE